MYVYLFIIACSDLGYFCLNVTTNIGLIAVVVVELWPQMGPVFIPQVMYEYGEAVE
jgi:hypothetical protein